MFYVPASVPVAGGRGSREKNGIFDFRPVNRACAHGAQGLQNIASGSPSRNAGGRDSREKNGIFDVRPVNTETPPTGEVCAGVETRV